VTLPAAHGRWKRVALTFTATKKDANSVASFVSKGVTQGLWLDDVKLEASARPTLSELAEGAGASCPGRATTADPRTPHCAGVCSARAGA